MQEHQKASLLSDFRDAWIRNGLSTKPADRAEAEEGVREAYRAANLEPPRLMVWLESPLVGSWCAYLLARDRLPPAVVTPGAAPFLEQATEAGLEILWELGAPDIPVRTAKAETVWSRVRSCLRGGWSDVSWDRETATLRRAIRNRLRIAADQ
jgi:hypothetical protein